MKNIYYVKLKIKREDMQNAGGKAVKDIQEILDRIGVKAILVPQLDGKRGVQVHVVNAKYFKQNVYPICNEKKEQYLVIQMPLGAHSIFLTRILRKLQKKQVRIIVLVHDINFLRFPFKLEKDFLSSARKNIEDYSLLRCADMIIVHNEFMKKSVMRYGIAEEKLVALKIFDYLIAPDVLKKKKQTVGKIYNHIVIAGNLRPDKSQYIYQLPISPEFFLYGANYDENRERQKNVTYMGSFQPDELAEVMQGDFGLVWDGDSVETCSGDWGQYLRYNNPHKTSLYLACGIPVIIWKEAALAPFILENHVGYAVESLTEISDLVSHVTSEEYQEMKRNVEKISEKLREGFYFKQALGKCIEKGEYTDVLFVKAFSEE